MTTTTWLRTWMRFSWTSYSMLCDVIKGRQHLNLQSVIWQRPCQRNGFGSMSQECQARSKAGKPQLFQADEGDLLFCYVIFLSATFYCCIKFLLFCCLVGLMICQHLLFCVTTSMLLVRKEFCSDPDRPFWPSKSEYKFSENSFGWRHPDIEMFPLKWKLSCYILARSLSWRGSTTLLVQSHLIN